jgi:hypothetical protein
LIRDRRKQGNRQPHLQWQKIVFGRERADAELGVEGRRGGGGGGEEEESETLTKKQSIENKKKFNLKIIT